MSEARKTAEQIVAEYLDKGVIVGDLTAAIASALTDSSAYRAGVEDAAKVANKMADEVRFSDGSETTYSIERRCVVPAIRALTPPATSERKRNKHPAIAALNTFARAVDELANEMPPPNAFTPRFRMLAIGARQTADAIEAGEHEAAK